MFCKLIKIPKKQTQNKCEKSKDKLARKRERERRRREGEQEHTLTKSDESRRVPGNRGDDSVRELTARCAEEAPTAPASEWNVSQEGYLVAESAALHIGIDYTQRRQKKERNEEKKRQT